MGSYEIIPGTETGMELSLAAGLLIATNVADLDRVRNSALAAGSSPAVFLPLLPEEPLPENLITQARVLVLEVDPASEGSLRRIANVRSRRPDLPIIAALHESNFSLTRTLIRHGVTDIVELPFMAEELAALVNDVVISLASDQTRVQLAPMYTVVRASGGCGATTIITHLAAALAERDETGRGVSVVDLDLQKGDIAYYLGKTPTVTIEGLLNAGNRLDLELLRGALIDSDHGFSVLAAPQTITPLDSVDTDQLLKLLNLLRSKAGLVLVDLPADWTHWSLSVANASTKLLLVTDHCIASLRQAKRRIELLESLGIESDRIKVVANRVEKGLFKALGTEEVGEALKCEVIGAIADSGANLRSAQDQGLLISDIASRSRFQKDIAALGDLLTRAAE
jgi:pilus assembly protein CpaE